MTKGRMEAFSDGVMAILITIMVLELGVPHGDTLGDLIPLGYAIAIPIALVAPWISFAIYVLVAMIWFVPDLRIERRITG